MSQVDANIPLMTRGAPVMGPQEQLQLAEIGRQMQIRNSVQQLANQPGMFAPSGVPTDQYITSLRQIDVGMADATVQKRAQYLAQQSLDAERAMKAQKEQIAEQKAETIEGLKGGVAAANAVPNATPQQRYEAMKTYLIGHAKQLKDSGKGKRMGWTDEDLDRMLTTFPTSVEDAITAILPNKEFVERLDTRNNRPGAPADAAATPAAAGTPLSDIKVDAGTGGLPPSGALVRPMTTQPIESSPLGQADPRTDVVGPNTTSADVKIAKDETGQDVIMPPGAGVTGGAVKEGSSFSDKADAAEAEAARLRGLGNKSANKEAAAFDKKAKDFRAAAAKERSADQTDEKIEISKAREQRIAKAADGGQLRQEDANWIADQIIAGNAQAGQGFARNVAGKAMIARAVTDRATAKGLKPTDLNANAQEWRGLGAEQTTLGHRAANLKVAAEELGEFATIASTASDKVPRANFVPLVKLQRLARSQWSPEQAAFEAANRSVINAFAQVASRSGSTTVHNTEEAENMLNTAQTAAQYKAVIKQLQAEATGALKAVGNVRGQIREEIGGGHENPTTDLTTKGVKRPQTTGPTSSKSGTGTSPKAPTVHWDDLK